MIRQQMSIRAYLRDAGLIRTHQPVTGGVSGGTEPRGGTFRQVFEAMAPREGGGMRIAEYRNSPVLTLATLPSAPQRVSCHAPVEGVLHVDRETSTLVEGTETPLAEKVGAGARSKAAIPAPGPSTSPDPTRAKELIYSEIRSAARKYNLSEDLIERVISAESGFDPKAVSSAGARGLMQLMPATARELGVDDSFDIAQNIDGGSRYLRRMIDLFDGDLALGLAAYNSGPGTVRRYQGIPPYRETIAYVNRVMGDGGRRAAAT